MEHGDHFYFFDLKFQNGTFEGQFRILNLAKNNAWILGDGSRKIDVI